jgi:hypothetical protein
MTGSRLIGTLGLLHCDKVPSFGHIGAATVPSVVQALIVSSDIGSGRSTALGNKRQADAKSASCRSGDFGR